MGNEPIQPDPADLHEGVVEFFHLKNSDPPFYRCVADMPPETALILDRCINLDRARQALQSESKEPQPEL